MGFLPFWAGGLALTSIVLFHYGLTRTQLGVSGRMTALVNRGREKLSGEPEISETDLVAAMRAMTAAEFGEESVGAAPAPTAESRAVVTTPPWVHVVFFAGLVLGGLLAALAVGRFAVVPRLSGGLFDATFHSGAAGYLTLALGGILVGVGTRMGGGCTSGHGLIGVPRMQPGSLLATASFFGTGIVVSFVLEVLR